MNVLFVCSMNKWRSRTAETLYGKHPLLNVRSAGTSNNARHKITLADINWAESIIVMEYKHLERIRAEFRQAVNYKDIHVIEVEDNFEYMDARLVEELKGQIDPILLEE